MAKNASLLVTSDNKQENIKITPDCAYYKFTLIDSDITFIKRVHIEQSSIDTLINTF